MWRVYKEAGREFPKLSKDDVIDYAIIEALTVKAAKEQQEAEKAREREEWKRKTSSDLQAFM